MLIEDRKERTICSGTRVWRISKYVSETTVFKFLNCMYTPQLYYCVASGDVGHRLEDDVAGESTNKRTYRAGEVWKKVIRREPQ